ncbi:RNA polymerase sigma factor [Actinoallomurus liliacearum]|uniref:RNA polymerase sigma factor n=2 Tax=Actinoallomurus liliacearum TaxID=1080073 RepID=A0ABP8TN62_9ACTN
MKAPVGFGEEPVMTDQPGGSPHDSARDVSAPARTRESPEPATADTTGFTDLYDRYFHDVYRYVAGRLGPDAADDIAADTFVIAFRKRDSFDVARGVARAWLLGIATNLVAQHRRKEVRRYRAMARATPDDHTDSHESRVIDQADAARLRPQIAKALAGLSTGDRDVLLLVGLGALSHDEVAQALGIPYGTVGSRLSRARKKVRAALGQEGRLNG